MLHLQCTKKILKIVGETKDGTVPLKPTLLSWHVNEFRVARRKLLLFTNDLTFYSVFWYPATKSHILNMKNVLASELMESLMDVGFTANQVEEYFTGFDHVIFTPTSSRQVLGIMNDLKQQLMFLMSDYYEQPLSFVTGHPKPTISGQMKTDNYLIAQAVSKGGRNEQDIRYETRTDSNVMAGWKGCRLDSRAVGSTSADGKRAS